MIGMRVADGVTEPPNDVGTLWGLVGLEAERRKCPCCIGPPPLVDGTERVGTLQVREQRSVRTTVPARRTPQKRERVGTCRGSQQRAGIHRSKDLRKRVIGVVKHERRLAVGVVAIETVPTAAEAHSVGLEAMTQARLRDTATSLKIVDQQVQVVAQLGIEARHKRRDDRREKQRAVGRIRRQEQLTEGDPSSGSNHPRVTNL